MKSTKLFILAGYFFTFAASVGIAKEQVGSPKKPSSPPPPQAIYEDGPARMRVSARHIEAKGIGYNQGYSTVDGFFPLYDGWNDWILFLDTRMHVFNSGRPALNAGLGARYLTDTRIWGFNAYYDYRKTKRYHYNQIAMGFESLGKIWDFRFNGYVPVGGTISNYWDTTFAKFKGNYAIMSQRYEFALAGFNAEAGAHVDVWDRVPLYFAAGPYYLTGKGATTWGGQLRAAVQIYDYLKLEGYTSYDHVFKWIGQGQIGLNFSFGKKAKVRKSGSLSCSESLALAKRAYQPVDRFEIVPVDRKHYYSKAMNPLTGDPYTFWFVNNTSHCNGTIESPCNTLEAVDTDVIYVFAGDGTSTGMNSGIVLKDNQRLWGSPIAQNLPTTKGNLVIPAMTGGSVGQIGFLPIISNTGGDVVILANNNEISGVFLQNIGSYNAISAANVTNAKVLNATLVGNTGQGNGLYMQELAGTLTVSNCIFDQNYGISLANSSTNLQANISNSSFSGDEVNGISILWELDNTSQGILTLDRNTIQSYQKGVEVDSTGTSRIVANINNNTITGEYGVYLNGTGASSATQILNLNNNIINTHSQTVYIIENGNTTANINGNTLNSNNYCLNVNAISGTSSITATNNKMATIEQSAVYFTQTDGSLSVSLNKNTLVSMKDYGISWNISGGTDSDISISNNQIYGYFAIQGEQSAGNLNLSILDNLLTAETAVSLTLLNPSTVLAMSGNACEGFRGILISQSIGVLDATFTENTIQVSGATGISYTSSGSASSSQIISGNTIGTIASSITLTLTSSSSMNGTIFNNNFVSNGVPAVMSSLTAGTQSLNLLSNTLTNSGGYSLRAQNGSDATWNVNNNQILISSTPPVAATCDNSNVCMQLNYNTAYPTANAYVLTNINGGNFVLNPPQGNIGNLSYNPNDITIGTCP